MLTGLAVTALAIAGVVWVASRGALRLLADGLISHRAADGLKARRGVRSCFWATDLGHQDWDRIRAAYDRMETAA